jgi:PAS domain S-box-containing protein
MSDTFLDWPQPSSIIQDLPVAYTEVDSKGILRVVNEAACRLHDLPAEELIGRAIWEFLPVDEAGRSRTDFFHAMESGEDLPPVRRSLLRADGEFRTHELHRRMMRDSDGTPIGMCCATFDVSEVEAAHKETKRTKLWLESVVEAIPQAIIVTDALGFVRFINPAAERLIGRSAEEVLGQQIEKGMPILRAVSVTKKPLSFRMALNEPWNGDVDIVSRQYGNITVWLSASPIVEKETGYTNGVVLVLRSSPVGKNDPPPRAPAPDPENAREKYVS